METNELLRTDLMSHPAHFTLNVKFEPNVLNVIPIADIAFISLARSVGFKEIGDIRDRKFFRFGKWPCNRDRR
jgi:hypothetical protein